MKKTFLLIALLLVSAAFLCGDVYIKEIFHKPAMNLMGQKTPASDIISERWIGDNKMVYISDKHGFIIDLQQELIFFLNHGKKTFIQMDMDSDIKKILPAQLTQMMGMMKVTLTVSPNGRTKTVKNWNCNGYDIAMGVQGPMPIKMQMNIWASPEVPFDWKLYQEKMGPMVMKASSLSMPITDQMKKEYLKIKGFQLASEVRINVMGQEMVHTTEVLEISDKPAPEDIYNVPAGYAKKEKFQMNDMQR